MIFFPCKYEFKQLTYELCLCSAHFLKQNELLKFTFQYLIRKNAHFCTFLKYKLIPSKIRSINFLQFCQSEEFSIENILSRKKNCGHGANLCKNRSFVGATFRFHIFFPGSLFRSFSSTFRGCFRFSEIIIFLETI